MCLPWGWLLLELDDCTWQSAHFSLVESLPPEASRMCPANSSGHLENLRIRRLEDHDKRLLECSLG
jgi:hypothetical protein